MDRPFFNYIVTIHNKQDLIRDVLSSLLICASESSKIFAVLDGCTDRTEEEVDQLTDQFAEVPITKVHTADVHEILSINAGLRVAPQEGFGYNIILQDDVVLADFSFERNVIQLYEVLGEKLGYVSFRLGANFRTDALDSSEPAPFTAYIENAYGHGLPNADILLPGRFARRSVPIKSPVCLPTRLVREVGLLNEELAPYMHDEVDFAVRLLDAGYFNGVFALRFFSDVKWGGTRVNPHPDLGRIQARNMDTIRRTYPRQIAAILAGEQPTEILQIIPESETDNARARSQFAKARKELRKQGYAEAGTLHTNLRRIWNALSRA